VKLQNLKINFLGDSITEGFRTSHIEKRFSNLMEKDCGLAAARNYGIGATRIAPQSQPTENVIYNAPFRDRVERMDADADIIVVFGGTNDYWSQEDTPLGFPGDQNDSTFCGACHDLFTRLRSRFPNACIVVLTPLHRVGENNCWEQGDRNRPCRPLRDYAEALRAVANIFGFPVLDLFSSGLMDPNDADNRAAFIPDGLHPNDAGHSVLAQTITAFLESLPSEI